MTSTCDGPVASNDHHPVPGETPEHISSSYDDDNEDEVFDVSHNDVINVCQGNTFRPFLERVDPTATGSDYDRHGDLSADSVHRKSQNPNQKCSTQQSNTAISQDIQHFKNQYLLSVSHFNSKPNPLVNSPFRRGSLPRIVSHDLTCDDPTVRGHTSVHLKTSAHIGSDCSHNERDAECPEVERQKFKENYIASLGLTKRLPQPKGLPVLKSRISQFETLMVGSTCSKTAIDLHNNKSKIDIDSHNNKSKVTTVVSQPAIKDLQKNDLNTSSKKLSQNVPFQSNITDSQFSCKDHEQTGRKPTKSQPRSKNKPPVPPKPKLPEWVKKRLLWRNRTGSAVAQYGSCEQLTIFDSLPKDQLLVNDQHYPPSVHRSHSCPAAEKVSEHFPLHQPVIANDVKSVDEILYRPSDGRDESFRNHSEDESLEYQRQRVKDFIFIPQVFNKVYGEEEKMFIEANRLSSNRLRSQSLGSTADRVQETDPKSSRPNPGKLSSSLSDIIKRFEVTEQKEAVRVEYSKKQKLAGGRNILTIQQSGRMDCDATVKRNNVNNQQNLANTTYNYSQCVDSSDQSCDAIGQHYHAMAHDDLNFDSEKKSLVNNNDFTHKVLVNTIEHDSASDGYTDDLKPQSGVQSKLLQCNNVTTSDYPASDLTSHSAGSCNCIEDKTKLTEYDVTDSTISNNISRYTEHLEDFLALQSPAYLKPKVNKKHLISVSENVTYAPQLEHEPTNPVKHLIDFSADQADSIIVACLEELTKKRESTASIGLSCDKIETQIYFNEKYENYVRSSGYKTGFNDNAHVLHFDRFQLSEEHQQLDSAPQDLRQRLGQDQGGQLNLTFVSLSSSRDGITRLNDDGWKPEPDENIRNDVSVSDEIDKRSEMGSCLVKKSYSDISGSLESFYSGYSGSWDSFQSADDTILEQNKDMLDSGLLEDSDNVDIMVGDLGHLGCDCDQRVAANTTFSSDDTVMSGHLVSCHCSHGSNWASFEKQEDFMLCESFHKTSGESDASRCVSPFDMEHLGSTPHDIEDGSDVGHSFQQENFEESFNTFVNGDNYFDAADRDKIPSDVMKGLQADVVHERVTGLNTSTDQSLSESMKFNSLTNVLISCMTNLSNADDILPVTNTTTEAQTLAEHNKIAKENTKTITPEKENSLNEDSNKIFHIDSVIKLGNSSIEQKNIITFTNEDTSVTCTDDLYMSSSCETIPAMQQSCDRREIELVPCQPDTTLRMTKPHNFQSNNFKKWLLGGDGSDSCVISEIEDDADSTGEYSMNEDDGFIPYLDVEDRNELKRLTVFNDNFRLAGDYEEYDNVDGGQVDTRCWSLYSHELYSFQPETHLDTIFENEEEEAECSCAPSGLDTDVICQRCQVSIHIFDQDNHEISSNDADYTMSNSSSEGDLKLGPVLARGFKSTYRQGFRGEDNESLESMDVDSLDEDEDDLNVCTNQKFADRMACLERSSPRPGLLLSSPVFSEAQNESPPLSSFAYVPTDSEVDSPRDHNDPHNSCSSSSDDHHMTVSQEKTQESPQKSKIKEKLWKEAEDVGNSPTSGLKSKQAFHLDLASSEMSQVATMDAQDLLESPGSGLHRISSECSFPPNEMDTSTRLQNQYKVLERSQSDASLIKKEHDLLSDIDEVHLTAAESSSVQNISECNRVYLDLSKAEAFERVKLDETSETMMRTSSGRLLETIPQDEELKTGDLSYVYATRRSFSQESSSSLEDLSFTSKCKSKESTKYKSKCSTSTAISSSSSEGNSLSSKSNLRSSFQIYSHSLKQKVRQLQMGSIPEQLNALTELNVLMEQAWSMPIYGKDLAYELCDILRTESALDIIVNNLASSNRELMKVSARLLEQSLTTSNRRQVAENGLELVVKMTHDARGDCELAQTCTGILESLFKTSEDTCARVIKLGGLDTITYWCRCNDRVTLKNCAIALSNLALYGGGENQQEMAKHKVPEWLFPLAFVEDDSVRYYALLAIGVLVSNKEIENAVMSSGTLALVLPFIDTHDPAEFAQRDMSHRHGRSPGWLKRLIPVLSSKREEAQALAAFHFVMEAGIKSEQGRKEVLYKIGAVEPLKWLASTPNRVASKLAAQALKIIGEEVPHKLSQQVPLWTCDDVVHWIAQGGFSGYADKFQMCQVDGDLLLRLTEEELCDSIGMNCAITRKRFLRELRDLKISSDYTSCDPSMLGAWLRDVSEDMSQYTYQMLHTGVDRPLLRLLKDNHLMEDCQIINGIHRMKILAKIEELRSALCSPTSAAYDSVDAISSVSSHKPPIDVFISYRRSNGSQLASLLKVHLQLRGFTVFIDIEKLRAGKFDESLLESVKQAKNFIIVLTPNSLDRCMGDVERKDWVHREITAAIEAGSNIIPLLDNFKWPSPDTLPEDMRNVCYFNAVRWIHDYQDACVDKLEQFLRGEPNTQQPNPSTASVTSSGPRQSASGFESPNSPPYQRAQGMSKTLSVDSPVET